MRLIDGVGVFVSTRRHRAHGPDRPYAGLVLVRFSHLLALSEAGTPVLRAAAACGLSKTTFRKLLGLVGVEHWPSRHLHRGGKPREAASAAGMGSSPPPECAADLSFLQPPAACKPERAVPCWGFSELADAPGEGAAWGERLDRSAALLVDVFTPEACLTQACAGEDAALAAALRGVVGAMVL